MKLQVQMNKYMYRSYADKMVLVVDIDMSLSTIINMNMAIDAMNRRKTK